MRTVVAVCRLGAMLRVPGTFTGGSVVTVSRIPRAGAAVADKGRAGGGTGGVVAGRTLEEPAVDAGRTPLDVSAPDAAGCMVPMPLVSAATPGAFTNLMAPPDPISTASARSNPEREREDLMTSTPVEFQNSSLP